jgi:predicted porin
MQQTTLKSGLITSVVVLLLPFSVQAETDVYGKLLLGIEYVDDQTDANDYWDVKSHASRFGLKGSFDTDTDSLKVIYQLEWEVDVSDEADSSNDHLKGRDQYVGLEGGFGQFIVGRSDTPFKKSQGKLDLFNDYVDIKVLMAGGENRENNVFQYSTPKIADAVTVSILGRPGEEADGENNGVADAISTSAAYDSASLYVALAFDSDIDGEDVKATRVSATWKFGDFGVGGLVQSTDWNTADNEQVILVNGFYKVGNIKWKVQFGRTENYAGIAANSAGEDNTADYAAIGLDYSLGRQTTLGGYIARLEGGDNLEVDPVIGGPYTRDLFGVILIHSF